jgi:branched-chain amino acid transport system ATP-binding protein
MSAIPLLKLNNVIAGYGKMNVVNNISIRVNQGEIVTLLGSNGVGKTSTLRTILAQTDLKKGEIKFKDKDITHFPTYKISELGIGYCPEGRAIFGNLTTKENLQAGAYLLKSQKKFKENLHRVYSLFPILKERSNQTAELLSGGEQEMLAIGRSLMNNPDLLLLDEPSLGLAPKLIELIGRILREINKEGVSILLIEQNAKLALEMSNYGYLMRKGTVVLEGNAKELATDERVKEIYLGIV